MPAIVVGISLKKGSSVFMDSSPGFSIHCFEGFGGNSIQAGRFSVLQLIDCGIDFIESDGGVSVMEGWALGDVVEYGLINRALVIEDVVKVGSKHSHVFFVIGRKFPIGHLHGHLNLLFVVDSSPPSEMADILPCNTWI
jgi:hypothetical protein